MEIKVNKYTIVIHREPLEILNSFTQNSTKAPESGGIIIGKIIQGQINIIKLSVPTILDKSSRTNFERNKVSAQIILDYEFYNSNGQLTYLGEWHTHPEPFPVPSRTDLQMLKQQFKSNKIMTEFILLLIRGTKGIYLRIMDEEGFQEIKLNCSDLII
ncbi:Mov34/MPN/PAD-1 family protein [Sphingobacterium daejeonense]|uniref:Mov34/MPN/PAD-1 family protein n=1 Tax=Sphingobacterium daejeonense TaxID=371142 RepID=UPI0021A39A09|nr:Mov34/MPN/PAD-1 family protein [Sphingobacterium daejeonense]MCT1531331.1 Mov34/MPN/PAD-1 family protein [Sphingobacterium daejeonense]